MSSVQKPKSCLSLVMYIRPTLMSWGIFTTTLTQHYAPKLAATSRLEQAAMTTPSSATSAMFMYL